MDAEKLKLQLGRYILDQITSQEMIEAIDAMQAQIDSLREICTNVHDRILRGDSDKELMELLEAAWKNKGAT